jgi:hypothetical protein
MDDLPQSLIEFINTKTGRQIVLSSLLYGTGTICFKGKRYSVSVLTKYFRDNIDLPYC